MRVDFAEAHLPPGSGTRIWVCDDMGMSGHFVGRIKGDKYRFELQFLKWDFS